VYGNQGRFTYSLTVLRISVYGRCETVYATDCVCLFSLETGQACAGREGVLMITGMNVSFGLYGYIAGDKPDKDTLG